MSFSHLITPPIVIWQSSGQLTSSSAPTFCCSEFGPMLPNSSAPFPSPIFGCSNSRTVKFWFLVSWSLFFFLRGGPERLGKLSLKAPFTIGEEIHGSKEWILEGIYAYVSLISVCCTLETQHCKATIF